MAVITGTVKGCHLLREDPSAGTGSAVGTTDSKLAYITFSMPIFANTDTGTLAVATAIQNQRRNGKTVTLRSACRGESGQNAAGTNFYTSTEAVSSGNITFQMCNRTGTQIAATGGVYLVDKERPMSLVVAYDET